VLPTNVDAAELARYSPEVEAAVYFCCLEALQNAGKHAGPDATVKIRVWQEPGALAFEVSDDGAGFASNGAKGKGAGFVNMGDRVGAMGGSLKVRSALGAGTSITGTIPL
jgi:signal transduction histidine kinase